MPSAAQARWSQKIDETFVRFVARMCVTFPGRGFARREYDRQKSPKACHVFPCEAQLGPIVWTRRKPVRTQVGPAYRDTTVQDAEGQGPPRTLCHVV